MDESNSEFSTLNSKLKLFHNTNSPFARKCRVVILEKGLQDWVEYIESIPPHDSPALLAANPLSKIPSLLLGDGRSLCESPLICEYLDSLAEVNPLFPSNKSERFAALELAALGSGIMDAAVACVMESRRPEDKQWPQWIERKENAIRRTIQQLAHMDFDEKEFNIGTINVAVALAYVGFRMPQINWKAEHTKLVQWLDVINKRASMLATAPVAA